MEKNNTPVKEKEVLNDYEATPVPDSEHMSWLSQGAVLSLIHISEPTRP